MSSEKLKRMEKNLLELKYSIPFTDIIKERHDRLSKTINNLKEQLEPYVVPKKSRTKRQIVTYTPTKDSVLQTLIQKAKNEEDNAALDQLVRQLQSDLEQKKTEQEIVANQVIGGRKHKKTKKTKKRKPQKHKKTKKRKPQKHKKTRKN